MTAQIGIQSNLFKSISVGMVAYTASLMKGGSQARSVAIGLVASFAVGFFLNLNAIYQENFSSTLEDLLNKNRVAYIPYKLSRSARFQLEENLLTNNHYSKNEAFYRGRLDFFESNFLEVNKRIEDLYKKLSSNYFLLKTFGMLTKRDVEIYEQIRSGSGNFYQKLQEKKVEVDDLHRVMDSNLIQKKIKKQLSCAETHRKNQKEFPFICQKVPEFMLENLGFLYRGFAVSRNSFLNIEVGESHVQGLRPYQEDAFVATSFKIKDLYGNFHTFAVTGVFDGHGGSEVSSYLKENLAKKVEISLQAIVDQKKEFSDEEIWNLLKIVCVDLSFEFKDRATSGSTASFSLLRNGEDLWLANVGDSRSFIATKNKVIQLSEDAKLSCDTLLSKESLQELVKAKNPEENCYESRILKGNGFVLNGRLNGTLSMARAIGDQHLYPSITARPKITKISLSQEFPEDDFCYLFHATDGLWDVVSTNQAAFALKQYEDPCEIARNLTYSAVKQYPGDNITVVVSKINLKELRG